MPKSPSPTAIDLFCGVGGFSLGLLQAGCRLAGAIDADPLVLSTYRKNFPKVATAESNLFAMKGRGIRESLGLGDMQLDIVVGGPPCQGFSSGGRQIETDPRNGGVLAFARLVTELRPRFFVMENVRGFLNSKYQRMRERLVDILEGGGYNLRLPIRALNACDYGIPQRRVRAFVLGSLQGECLPDYPEPTLDYKATVKDAIGDLTLIDRCEANFDTDTYCGLLGEPSAYALKLRGQQPKRLTGCLLTRHSPLVVKRFRATEQGGQEPISRYFRLSWHSLSPTLRAGTGPDHGSHTAPRPIHPSRPRCITVREAARLHSFPDRFVFHATRWHGFRQIGNSVPPMWVKAVIENLAL